MFIAFYAGGSQYGGVTPSACDKDRIMDFKEAKATIMQLINMYSERGAIFTSNDKNIADFEIKVRNYLNIALKTVSNRFPMRSTVEIVKTASDTEQEPVVMPQNFLRLDRLYKMCDGTPEEYQNYYWVTDNTFALPAKEEGVFLAAYLRLSGEIPESAPLSTKLDVPKILENAVCYYAAGMLIQSERPDIASRLFEQYTELMSSYHTGMKLQRRIKR